jgi:hypothetical protein
MQNQNVKSKSEKETKAEKLEISMVSPEFGPGIRNSLVSPEFFQERFYFLKCEI